MDGGMKLKKKFDLTKLVQVTRKRVLCLFVVACSPPSPDVVTLCLQIETSNSSNTRVNFVFTNEGAIAYVTQLNSFGVPTHTLTHTHTDTDDAGGDRNSKKDTEMLASHEIFSLECRSKEQRKTLVEHIANAQRAAMPEADGRRPCDFCLLLLCC